MLIRIVVQGAHISTFLSTLAQHPISTISNEGLIGSSVRLMGYYAEQPVDVLLICPVNADLIFSFESLAEGYLAAIVVDNRMGKRLTVLEEVHARCPCIVEHVRSRSSYEEITACIQGIVEQMMEE